MGTTPGCRFQADPSGGVLPAQQPDRLAGRHDVAQLADLEAVFRSLKSELGLRPIFHQKEHRSKGHLFITVLAYQLVQVIRRRLGEQGEHSSWPTLRSILAGQQRVTATFRCADGRTLHVPRRRRPSLTNTLSMTSWELDPAPGGSRSWCAAVAMVTGLRANVVPLECSDRLIYSSCSRATLYPVSNSGASWTFLPSRASMRPSTSLATRSIMLLSRASEAA